MENKKFRVAKRTLTVLLTALFVLSLLALLVNAALSKKEGKPTFLFGYSLLWVQTGSMEPTIPACSYILVRASDGENLPDGTVITYISKDETSPVFGSLVTHRILSHDAAGYHTKGDHTSSHPDPVPVKEGDIVATYVRNLPVLSVLGRIFASPVGLILTLAFFLVTTTFLYIPDIVSALKEEKDGKTAEEEKEKEKEKEKEIRRRIEEEVRKLEESDRKGEKK